MFRDCPHTASRGSNPPRRCARREKLSIGHLRWRSSSVLGPKDLRPFDSRSMTIAYFAPQAYQKLATHRAVGLELQPLVGIRLCLDAESGELHQIHGDWTPQSFGCRRSNSHRPKGRRLAMRILLGLPGVTWIARLSFTDPPLKALLVGSVLILDSVDYPSARFFSRKMLKTNTQSLNFIFGLRTWSPSCPLNGWARGLELEWYTASACVWPESRFEGSAPGQADFP